MKLWTCTVREGQRRPGRTLLTLAGISLGLATIVAIRLTVPTAERAYRELFEGVAGRPVLEIAAPGQAGFDPALVRGLTKVRGVQAVVPRIRAVASVVGTSGSVAVPVLGLDPVGLAVDWPARKPTAALAEHDALLDASLAETLGRKSGDRLRLWTPAGPAELHLAGTLPAGGSSGPCGVLVVSLARARDLFALPGQINSVELVLEDGADPEQVRAVVGRRLPKGVAVQPPGTHGGLARSTLQATELGLAALGFLAVTAAAFVILNTFLLNVGERRQQLAVLRALGASRAQVRLLLLREALLLGLAGTLLGGIGGVVLSRALLHGLANFLGLPLPQPRLTAGPFILAGLLGPGVALAAAWVPACCASRRQPLDDLLPQRGQQCDRLSRSVAWLGVLLLALGGLLAGVLCLGWLPGPVCAALLAPALALVLAGSVLTLPGAVGPVLRALARLPLGLSGKLAAQQLSRRRTRTGLTAGVLFLALAVAVGFGHCLQAILHDMQHWCRRTIVADFLVRGAMPDTAFTLAAALPEMLAKDLARSSKDVAAVERLSWLPTRANGQPVLVLARDFEAGQPLPLDLREGKTDDVRRGLQQGGAVVATGLAQQLGLHRGDVLMLETEQGTQPVPIVGTATEYAVGGSALYLDWNTAGKLLPLSGVNVFLLRARPGRAAALAPSLRRFCDTHHLLLQSNAEFSRMVDRLLGRVTGLLWALLALVFVLASLAVVNTLTMNVHEQKRELGILRALGLLRGQVQRLVLVEALLLGLIGLVPGALAGIGLAYLIDRATAWVGPPVPFRLDGLVLLGCCGLALGAAFVAGLLPGRYAARLPVLRALADA
jgi:putative ABC transport system permease protein